MFGWVARQGMIEGLDLVDFNYPQHLENDEAKQMQDPTLNLRFKIVVPGILEWSVRKSHSR